MNKLPTMAQLEKLGPDAGKVLDAIEQEIDQALVEVTKAEDLRNLKEKKKRLQKLREELAD